MDNLLGKIFDANVKVEFDTPSLIRAAVAAIGAGVIILVLSKIIDRLIK
jgi:hypothetical protein